MSQPLYKVRHEGPFRPGFEGHDVRLGIGALTLDVDHFEILQPRRTWVREASHPQEREMSDTLAGVVYGHGNVEFSRTRGELIVDSEEEAVIPRGQFEKLTEEERAEFPAAGWKFSFDHTERPTVRPM